jgi:hypothetical protein
MIFPIFSFSLQSPHVEREIIIKGWQVYVRPANDEGSSSNISTGSDVTSSDLTLNRKGKHTNSDSSAAPSSAHPSCLPSPSRTQPAPDNSQNQQHPSHSFARGALYQDSGGGSLHSADLVLHPLHAAMRVSFRHSSVAAPTATASPATAPSQDSNPQLPPVIVNAREGVGGGMQLGVFVGTECIQLQV